MSIIELNAEITRAVNSISDDETLMLKVLKYIRRLMSKRQDEEVMSREEFLAKLDKGEEEYHRGEAHEILPGESLDDFLTRVGK